MAEACPYCQSEIPPAKYVRKYCSRICANRASNAKRARQRPESRLNRNRREAIAPGIPYRQRRALLAKWIREGRTCAYCPAPADSLDHVVPLIRGGTNWEGNLAPCCRRCNSSKAELLISEWRTGRRCSVTPYVMPTVRMVKPKHKPEPILIVSTCPLCMSQHIKARKYCSDQCAHEYNARRARERYRVRVGLSPTWHRPVRYSPSPPIEINDDGQLMIAI